MKNVLIGVLLGLLMGFGGCCICAPFLGVSDAFANLLNCLIGGIGLLGVCVTLFFQAKATDLQAKATSDQIEANRMQCKSQFRQEVLNSFSVISDRKDKIKIIQPVSCALPPPEQRTDVSTQFTVHCAILAILISKYSDCAGDLNYEKMFEGYSRQFDCLINDFFPFAIAFKNAVEKITGNKLLDSQDKKALLKSLHETLSTNDVSSLGIIFRLPHFKNSEWINEHFTRELCVQSVRNSIKNVCANRQLKDALQQSIGCFSSQVRWEQAATTFVCGLENATMEENTYWSLYVATCCSKE